MLCLRLSRAEMMTKAHLGLGRVVTSSNESGIAAVEGLGLERGPEGRVAEAGYGSHCMTMRLYHGYLDK